MSNHLVFVLASYGLGALILLALVAWLWLDRNATIKELQRLEKMGLRRRSDENNHE